LLCNRCGKGRLPMVNVTNRPHIYMWLCPLEFLLSHQGILLARLSDHGSYLLISFAAGKIKDYHL